MDVCEKESEKSEKMFTLKKWNAVAMWSWDVECDTCAICRVHVMDAFVLTDHQQTSWRRRCVFCGHDVRWLPSKLFVIIFRYFYADFLRNRLDVVK
uniref:Anaphase-promoting complex subunit 11 RING-H2 finger domain-containing protein n=1 Tax=Strigamia maritima TaxID=126957 RepID=T1JKS7_STRMM